jgi:hypothetical protein
MGRSLGSRRGPGVAVPAATARETLPSAVRHNHKCECGNAGVGVLSLDTSPAFVAFQDLRLYTRWVSVFRMAEWGCVGLLLAFGNIDAMYLYSKLQSIIAALFPAVPDRVLYPSCHHASISADSTHERAGRLGMCSPPSQTPRSSSARTVSAPLQTPPPRRLGPYHLDLGQDILLSSRKWLESQASVKPQFCYSVSRVFSGSVISTSV